MPICDLWKEKISFLFKGANISVFKKPIYMLYKELRFDWYGLGL